MNEQKGFSAVESLLILLIVGIVGFSGRYTWSRQRNNVNQANSIQNNQEAIEPKQKDEISSTQKNEDLSHQNDSQQPAKLLEGWAEQSTEGVPFTYAIPSDWVGKTGNASTELISEWKWPEKFSGYVVRYDSTNNNLKATELFSEEFTTESAQDDLEKNRPPIASNLSTPVYLFGFSDAENCTSKFVFRVNETELGVLSLGGTSPTTDGDISCSELNNGALEKIALTIQLRSL